MLVSEPERSRPAHFCEQLRPVIEGVIVHETPAAQLCVVSPLPVLRFALVELFLSELSIDIIHQLRVSCSIMEEHMKPSHPESGLSDTSRIESKRPWTAPQIYNMDIGLTAGGFHPPPYFTEIKGVLGCTKTNTTSALTHNCS